MIDCRECQDYLEESALREEASLSPEARRHLDDCAACRSVLDSLREGWALLPLALDAEAVSPQLESRLMSQVAANSRAEGHASWRSAALVKYGLAASILILVMSSVIVWSRRQVAATRDASEHASNLRQQLDQLNEWRRGFAHPKLQFVSLQHVSEPVGAQAYFVHDRLGEEGHFFAFDLKRQPEGEVYKLWVLAKDGQVSASAVLEFDGKGIASTTVAIPERSADIVRVLVTAELDAGATSPSEDARLQADVE